jgi:hypothetical protein
MKVTLYNKNGVESQKNREIQFLTNSLARLLH